MIEFLKKQWREVFYKAPEPFFKFDGWAGLDKWLHMLRHVIFISAAIGFYFWLGPIWGMIAAWVFYDTLFDVIYEYKDYCRGNGFSILDFCYGRAGMFLTLFVLYLLWIR